MEILHEALLIIAKALHSVAYARTQQKGGGRHSTRAKTPWDELEESDVQYYLNKVRPVIEAVQLAGYVILPQGEVGAAWLPRKEVQVARPVIRLGAVSSADQSEWRRRRG